MNEGYTEQFGEYVENSKEKNPIKTVEDLTEALGLIRKVTLDYAANGIESFDELNFRDLSGLRGQDGADDITRILEIFEKYNINRSTKISKITDNIEERIRAAKDIVAFEEHIRTHKPNQAVEEEVRNELQTAAKGDYTINKFSENNPKDGRKTDVMPEPVTENQTSNKMEKEKLLELYKTIEELKESFELFRAFLLKREVRNIEEFASLPLSRVSELKGVDGFEDITKALDIFEKYKIDFDAEIKDITDILKKRIKETERMIEQFRQ